MRQRRNNPSARRERATVGKPYSSDDSTTAFQRRDFAFGMYSRGRRCALERFSYSSISATRVNEAWARKSASLALAAGRTVEGSSAISAVPDRAGNCRSLPGAICCRSRAGPRYARGDPERVFRDSRPRNFAGLQAHGLDTAYRGRQIHDRAFNVCVIKASAAKDRVALYRRAWNVVGSTSGSGFVSGDQDRSAGRLHHKGYRCHSKPPMNSWRIKF
jgi:hypothetical protein